MKAIVSLTPEEARSQNATWAALKKVVKGESLSDLLDVRRRTGYAHYTFEGRYTHRLVELLGRHPTSDEIIMLVDGGFSHFGATCGVSHDRMIFSGRVNTD